MPELVLNEEQSTAVRAADGPVTVRDQSGHVLGKILPDQSPSSSNGGGLTEEVLAKLERRMAMKDIQWLTTEEVLEKLSLLDDK